MARGGMMVLMILTLLEVPQVGSRHAGVAGGLFFSVAEVGGVLGPVTIGLMSDMTGSFSTTLMMLTSICVILMILLAVLRRLSPRA